MTKLESKQSKLFGSVAAATALLGVSLPCEAEPADAPPVLGLKLRAGGRFDNVRMCVASPPDTQGGPAFDIAFFAELAVQQDMIVAVDLPVMRPVVFGTMFDMLQFEPDVTWAVRFPSGGDVDPIVGSSLGLSLHYGPDYRSGPDDDERGPSFFAMGPRFGGYFGLDFVRPGKLFNFQLGVHPFVTPLIGIDDPEDHRGVVVGGTLDGQFRFDTAE